MIFYSTNEHSLPPGEKWETWEQKWEGLTSSLKLSNLQLSYNELSGELRIWKVGRLRLPGGHDCHDCQVVMNAMIARWSLENAASLVFDRRLNWDEAWGKMMVSWMIIDHPLSFDWLPISGLHISNHIKNPNGRALLLTEGFRKCRDFPTFRRPQALPPAL